MADKYVKIDMTTGRLTQQAATDVGGSGHSGKIVALDSNGLIPSSMLTGLSGSDASVTAVATQALAAGDTVNIYYSGTVSGNVAVRKATATDATAPANGYVAAIVNSGDTATVKVSGVNVNVPRGSLATTDIGKRVFLSVTAGAVTLTPPSTTGNLIQAVGTIVSVDTSVVWVLLEMDDGYVV